MLRPLALAWLTLILTACSAGGTPALIGAYPREDLAAPQPGPAPTHLLLVYTSFLTLEVSNVDAAAERAVQLARDFGGYLGASQAWHQDGRKHISLTLAVPVPYFDALRAAVLDLGTLVNETVSGEARPAHARDWQTYSHITVHLRPAPPALALPSLPATGWDPARTFRRAFGLSWAVITFLVDLVIWVTVVGAPFLLLGLGARAVVRRFWRR